MLKSLIYLYYLYKINIKKLIFIVKKTFNIKLTNLLGSIVLNRKNTPKLHQFVPSSTHKHFTVRRNLQVLYSSLFVPFQQRNLLALLSRPYANQIPLVIMPTSKFVRLLAKFQSAHLGV